MKSQALALTAVLTLGMFSSAAFAQTGSSGSSGTGGRGIDTAAGVTAGGGSNPGIVPLTGKQKKGQVVPGNPIVGVRNHFASLAAK